MNDIDVVPEAEREIGRLAPDFLAKLKASGFTFTAGID